MLDKELQNKRLKFEHNKSEKVITKSKRALGGDDNLESLQLMDSIYKHSATNEFKQKCKNEVLLVYDSLKRTEEVKKEANTIKMSEYRKDRQHSKLKTGSKKRRQIKQDSSQSLAKNETAISPHQILPLTETQGVPAIKDKSKVKTDYLFSKYGESRAATANLNLGTKIFSMTTPDGMYPQERHNTSQKRYREARINFIDKNKKLGRVSAINKRRFSGAFDHLNLFPSESEAQERLKMIKSRKIKVTQDFFILNFIIIERSTDSSSRFTNENKWI